MSEPRDRPRLYGEKDVAKILERATEIQASEGHAAGRSPGLSLAELEEIAAEAGIPRDFLRQAALELDAQGGGGSFAALTGDSPTVVFERTLPFDIDVSTFETLVVEIQRLAGSPGQAGVLGRTLTWQAETPSGSRWMQVIVTSRAGSTSVRIEERFHQLAGQLFGGLVGGVGGGVGVGLGIGIGLEVLGSALIAVAWPVGVVAAAYATARALFTSTVRTRRVELRRLMDVLLGVVEETAAVSGNREEQTDGPSLQPPRTSPGGRTPA